MIINEELRERMTRKNQLRTLLLDEEWPEWQKAHFALFMLDAMDRDDQTWLVYLNLANIAYRRGNEEMYAHTVSLMKKFTEWTVKDDLEVLRLKHE